MCPNAIQFVSRASNHTSIRISHRPSFAQANSFVRKPNHAKSDGCDAEVRSSKSQKFFLHRVAQLNHQFDFTLSRALPTWGRKPLPLRDIHSLRTSQFSINATGVCFVRGRIQSPNTQAIIYFNDSCIGVNLSAEQIVAHLNIIININSGSAQI